MSHLDYDGLKEVCSGLKRHSDDSYSIVLNEHNKLNKTVTTLKNTVDGLTALPSGSTNNDAAIVALQSDVQEINSDLIYAESVTEKPVVKLNTDIVIENIVSEGNTQILAIQSKGNTVLDSIPSDYNTLIEDINELKSDLTNHYFKTLIYPLYINQSTVVGVINDSNGQVVSSIIEAKTVWMQEIKLRENKVSFINCRAIAFYDSKQNFISAENVPNTVSIPSNAKYISYSWNNGVDFSAVYGDTISKPLYEIGVLTTLEQRVNALEYSDTNVDADIAGFLGIGDNIFNKKEELQDKFLNDGSISDFEGYCVSDFIKVKAGNNYVINKDLPKYDLFDNNKDFILESAYTTGDIITPSQDGYIVICYYSPSSDKHTSEEMMIIKGDALPSSYKSYCYYPLSTDEYPVDFNATWYKDKCICTLGDSNTANERWQDYMCSKLKCTYQNCGIGGSSMAGTDEHAMWTDFRINQISDKANAILIMAGTNDGASSREVGTMSTDNEDTNTFVGAYNTCIRKIYTKMGVKFPIFLFTPIPCFDNTTYPRVKEIAQAVRDIGAMWSIPVIDAQKECGINVANWQSLYASDGVHVDYDGGKLLASLVVGVLKSHEPID